MRRLWLMFRIAMLRAWGRALEWVGDRLSGSHGPTLAPLSGERWRGLFLPTKDTHMASNITGRDDYLIAQALYIAIRTLRQAEFPRESNIEEMETLLRTRFPGYRETFELQHYLRLARARGWRQSGSVTVDDLKRWLAENPDSGQVLPFRPPD